MISLCTSLARIFDTHYNFSKGAYVISGVFVILGISKPIRPPGSTSLLYALHAIFSFCSVQLEFLDFCTSLSICGLVRGPQERRGRSLRKV